MEDGVVSLSTPTEHVSLEVLARVQAANQRLRSRAFDVFYGPIKDNAGRIHIEAGESMSDYEMLNNFNWYVEGVKIEGQGVGGA